MKKLLLFAAVAGLGLVSASPPVKGPGNGADEAGRHYPPCSRSVTDRCIQLYERGVRGRHDRADHARDEHHGHGERYAMDDHRGRGDHGAMDGRRGRPDGDGPDGHRWCPEHRAHHGDHHGGVMADHRSMRRVAMAARATRVVGCRCARPARRQIAQRVRRAGERG